MKIGRRHLLIPDVQVKPKQSFKHLEWAGRYAADKQPEVIVQIGDFADMPSLSGWDRGRRDFENRRYRLDVSSTKAAMEVFMNQLAKVQGYKPIMHLTLGNHEARIDRATQDSPELEGALSVRDLGFEEFGWQVHDFLEVLVVDGIAYSHFFPRSSNGKVMQSKNGAPSARAQLIREGRSATAGHVQGFDIACAPIAGRLQWGLQAGSYYLHDEKYLGPQGNNHWRGLVLKNGVDRGMYSPIPIDIGYLKKRYSPVSQK
jgi:hypothetical protein